MHTFGAILLKTLEEIENSIRATLEKLRPYLQEDGGDAEFVAYEEDNKVAVIRFLGNCIDCPLSMMTLRGGIERFILNENPEVKRVEKTK